MKPKIIPFGDSAVLVQFGDEIDPRINQQIHALDQVLQARPLPGVLEAVPAYATLLLIYDPLQLRMDQVSAWVMAGLDRISTASHPEPRHITIPVRYGGGNGPDLEFVASYHHIHPRQVVQMHTAREYVVYMMGFSPGFPYMGRLEKALAAPRLETPRTRVPAGSVGIAGFQTGIYPIESPGGWRLIGRTSVSLFDPTADQPFLFSPGDRVRFVAEAIDV